MNVSAQAIDATTTGALVVCSNPRFTDADENPTPDLVTMDMAMIFNGRVSELGDKVSFARNATLTQKQAAVRLRVNQLLVSLEPGAVALTNAAIQIVGLPV